MSGLYVCMSTCMPSLRFMYNNSLVSRPILNYRLYVLPFMNRQSSTAPPFCNFSSTLVSILSAVKFLEYHETFPKSPERTKHVLRSLRCTRLQWRTGCTQVRVPALDRSSHFRNNISFTCCIPRLQLYSQRY